MMESEGIFLFTKPWKKNSKWHYPIDTEYKKMIRRKHRLWTRWREKQTVEAEQAYKKQRNLVHKESGRLETKQQCEVAKTCKTKPKSFGSMLDLKERTEEE